MSIFITVLITVPDTSTELWIVFAIPFVKVDVTDVVPVNVLVIDNVFVSVDVTDTIELRTFAWSVDRSAVINIVEVRL